MVPRALPLIEEALSMKKVAAEDKLRLTAAMDMALGLNLMTITRADMRVRPKSASLIEDDFESEHDRRPSARAGKEFATYYALREALTAQRVAVMDGYTLHCAGAIPHT